MLYFKVFIKTPVIFFKAFQSNMKNLDPNYFVITGLRTNMQGRKKLEVVSHYLKAWVPIVCTSNQLAGIYVIRPLAFNESRVVYMVKL